MIAVLPSSVFKKFHREGSRWLMGKCQHALESKLWGLQQLSGPLGCRHSLTSLCQLASPKPVPFSIHFAFPIWQQTIFWTIGNLRPLGSKVRTKGTTLSLPWLSVPPLPKGSVVQMMPESLLIWLIWPLCTLCSLCSSPQPGCTGKSFFFFYPNEMGWGKTLKQSFKGPPHDLCLNK